MRLPKFTSRFIRWASLLTALVSVNIAAAPLTLSNIPLPTATTSVVKPNIMFILDNSGSMNRVYMPDTVSGGSITGVCAPSNSTGINQCSATVRHSFKNSICNGVYYDPNTTYSPPVDYLGNSYANSTFTAAPRDGYGVNPTGSCNLSNQFDPASTACAATLPANAAYYYRYTGPPSTPLPDTCYADNRYTLVTVSATSGPGATDERQNFANWYTYYRNRINTMKTAMGRAFVTVGPSYRVGFSTINDSSGNDPNNNGDNFLNIADFDTTGGTASQKALWYTRLYSINPSGFTPLQEALRKTGEYFRIGSMGYTGGTASIDPVQFSCQQNFAILSTDGFWNNNGVTPAQLGGIGNQDKTIPTLPVAVSGLTSTAVWPRPFWEGSSPAPSTVPSQAAFVTASSVSLADVAMHYWATDLRPTGTFSANNVPSNTNNPATWQHMVTYGIGLANGTLTYPTALTSIQAGTLNWPVPVANTETAIDDLWHAAVNSRGDYFKATSTAAVISGLSSILNSISALQSTSSSATLSSNQITGTNNTSYATTYETANWVGDVNAFAINTSNGQFGSTPLWSVGAQGQLDSATTAASDTRRIASFNPVAGSGIRFLWSTISTAQKTQLNNTQSLLEFLRGWRGREDANAACSGLGTCLYRSRTHVLGDIVNSAAAYVGAPTRTYTDNDYDTFKTAQASRVPTLYVGANDGMLHAFDADPATGGAERWAYVPNLLMGRLKELSYKVNGTPAFSHSFYVDGSPTTGDVDFTNTVGGGGASDWRTILVSGLNRGGMGFFALDVTNPVAASEAAAASKVLWEFPNVNNLTHAPHITKVGFSYGKPIITKLPSYGWVVLVTSGYNNGVGADSSGGDGRGYLFILNAANGNLLKVMQTTGDQGTTATPSGFSRIAPYLTNTFANNTAERVYGGDLSGDFWRFDLSDPSPTNWTVNKLAHLSDPSSVNQPITTTPFIADINGKHMVYVGTGSYLTIADTSNLQIQSIYALKDDLVSNIGDVRSEVVAGNIIQQTLTLSGTTAVTASNNPVDLNTKKGWMIDLIPTGIRATRPIVIEGTLAFTANLPSTTACSSGGLSWLFTLNSQNGSNLNYNGVNLAGGFIGNVISTELVPFTINGTSFVSWRTSGPTTFNGIGGGGGGGGGVGIPGVGTPGGGGCVGVNCSFRPPPPSADGLVKRVFWREIVN